MTEKKEERIFDNPTPEQVKALLAKAKESKKKSQEKKKGSPDKFDLLLTKIDGLVKRQDRLESAYNKGVVTLKRSPDSGKKATGQENQPTNEEVLAQVQAEQEKATGQGKPRQTQPQQQGQGQPFYETPEYKKLSDKEARLAWEEGARQQQQQLQAQQGNPNNWGKIMQGINAVSPVVIEAMRGNKSNSGSIGSFFENLKIYSGVENAMLGNVFRFFKLLSPNQQAQGAQSLIEKAAKLPGFPELPPIDTGHIGE